MNSLPKREVQKRQRARLVHAIARAVAERGYADTAVSHILAHAGVSRAAFYELFKDKDECFLYGYNRVSRAQIQSLAEAIAGAGSLPEQLAAGVTAYLQVLDLDHTMARAFVVEAEAASPAIRSAFSKVVDQIEGLIRDWFERVRGAYPEVPASAELAFRALRSGLTGTLIGMVKEGAPRLANDANIVSTFVLATLGLYSWAKQAEGGDVPTGPPR
ncbi:MAG TPA: TetR/AcrR family transcriptional regulator [Solimonas sp.]|nr:TetR/AcrR family transcriptional regulator [Solimonas sp.]